MVDNNATGFYKKLGYKRTLSRNMNLYTGEKVKGATAFEKMYIKKLDVHKCDDNDNSDEGIPRGT